MAAVIEFRTGSAIQEPSFSPEPARRPQLSVIHGGRSPQVRRLRRTYLQRRLLVAVAALAVVVFLGAAASAALSNGAATTSARTEVHTVRPGDTLWQVAAAADPQADPRDVIDHIVQLNSGSGSSFSPDAPLRVGQQLTVPASAG